MAQRAQLSEARTRRLGPQPQMPEMMPEEPAPEPALLEQETALTASNVSLEEMIPVQGSASKHKLSMFLDSRSAAEGSDKGCVITRSSFRFYSRLWPVLNVIISASSCKCAKPRFCSDDASECFAFLAGKTSVCPVL